MDARVYCLLLFILSSECTRLGGQNAGRESQARAKSLKNRGDEVEHLFNVYDPSFLALVWPKISNGVHLRLGHFCWEDFTVFLKDLIDGRAWAYNVVDATGRYQGGLYAGSRFWLGSKQQCSKLDNDFLTRAENITFNEYYDSEYLKEVLQREMYYSSRGHEWQHLAERDEVIQRAVAADNRPPFRLAYSVAQLRLNVTKLTMAKSFDVILGLCLPRSCGIEDIESIITFSIMINDNLKTNKTVPRLTKITSLRQVEDYYHIENDTGALILICVTIFLVLLSIIATFVEFNLIKCKLGSGSSRSVSFDLQKYNDPNAPSKYFGTVSKKHNDIAWKDANIAKSAVDNVDKGKVDALPLKHGMKASMSAPSVTLDVISAEKATGSCNRCGKYKRQCSNPTQNDNVSACPRVKYSSVASVSTYENNDNLWKRLLLCYSLTYSWKRIFNTNMANKDLSVIHLMRILGTLWVIYIHVAMMVNYIGENAGDINDRNNVYYVLATGTLAFDTLFFVSGLFSAHHFFYLKSHYTLEELVSFGGTCGQVLQFVCFVTNRIIRLLPSYAFAILVCGVVARMSRETAALSLPDGDEENCDRYWWRNLLYVTNIFPANERCMQVSWYLSAESQLHAAGALALAARGGGARARAVSALSAAGLLAAAAADIAGAYAHYGRRLSGVYEAYALIIERTYARAVPYFIGVLTGWMVHKTNGRVNISNMSASCLWFASLATMATSSVVPWLAADWLSAWLHVTWPIALLWPALVCSTNFASRCRRVLDSGAVAALSRLSGGALLLHAAAARALLPPALGAGALCAAPVCVWSYFAGTTLLTLFGALILCLLVEMPCCSILRRLSDCATV